MLNILRGLMAIAANFIGLRQGEHPRSFSASTVGATFLQKLWQDIKKLRQMADLVFACFLIWRRYLGLY